MRERRRDEVVGRGGQSSGHLAELPYAAEIAKSDEKRDLLLGLSQLAHAIGFCRLARCFASGKNTPETGVGRLLKQTTETRRIGQSEMPEIGRMIGKSRQEPAHPRPPDKTLL